MPNPFTDPDALKKSQYAKPTNLQKRQYLHEHFSTNEQRIFDWMWGYLLPSAPDNATVLEVGCGPANLWQDAHRSGRYPEGWQLTLTDFSEGMLETAKGAFSDMRRKAKFQIANVMELPFEDNQFDLVIANFMLYHVPNLPNALAEIQRVLKPNGKLFAMTNALNHMKELKDIVRTVFGDSSFNSYQSFARSFSLDNGFDVLSTVFDRVEQHHYPDGLRITEAEPLVEYLMSMASMYEDEYTDAGRAKLLNYIEGKIARRGAVVITKNSGAFIAWNP